VCRVMLTFRGACAGRGRHGACRFRARRCGERGGHARGCSGARSRARGGRRNLRMCVRERSGPPLGLRRAPRDEPQSGGSSRQRSHRVERPTRSRPRATGRRSRQWQPVLSCVRRLPCNHLAVGVDEKTYAHPPLRGLEKLRHLRGRQVRKVVYVVLAVGALPHPALTSHLVPGDAARAREVEEIGDVTSLVHPWPSHSITRLL
jgi:hypothetical protein